MSGHASDLGARPALLDAWNSVLDDFEAALESAIEAAAKAGNGSAPIDTAARFSPPSSMPPFPAELAERARSLLARNEAAITCVTAVSDRVHRPGTLTPQTGPRTGAFQRGSAVPSFDARA